jgi:hypothetical protein
VRIAAQPLSNVYTVLLIIGLLAMALSLVMLWVTLEKRYAVSWAAGEEGKKALDEPAAQTRSQAALATKIEDQEKIMKGWGVETPKSVEAAKPAEGAKPVEGAVPAPPAPATPLAP